MLLLKQWTPYQLIEVGIAMALASVTDLPTAIGALLLLVLVDVATGVAAAYRRGEAIRSRRYFEGLTQKLLSVALIAPVWWFERYFGEASYPFASWVAYVVAFGELLSIVENLDALGVPLAGRLLRKLEETRNDELSGGNRPE